MTYKVLRKGKDKKVVVEIYLDDYESNNASRSEINNAWRKIMWEIDPAIIHFRKLEQQEIEKKGA